MGLSLKFRFLLIIALVFTIILAVIVSLNYTDMKQGILQYRLEEAENVKNILKATRRVSTDFDNRVSDRPLNSENATDEIESMFYASLRSFAFVFIVSFFISLFLVYLVMDKIFLNQLNKIIAASKKIASGNFDINIPVNNEGELGKVAIAFNSMTEALQDWQSKQDKLYEKAYRYKDQMQFVFDNTASVIYMKDLKGQYIYINKTFEKTFNISNEEILGKTDAEIMPAESAKHCSESDQEVLAIGKQVEFTESVPLDDGMHTYTSTKFPLKSQKGEIYGIGGISTDITERLKSEKVLNERLDELEQFNLMAVGRELKMMALKKEVNQLLIEEGKDCKYKVEK